MKKEKIIILLILVVFVAIGWVATVKAATGVDKIKEQNSMVEEADVLYEKGLYVRAIPLYEDALTIDTNDNKIIEGKLLSAYLKHGDDTEYVNLVKKRMKAGESDPDEVYEAASLLLSGYSSSKAMDFLESAMKEIESEKLIDLYENNAYRYRITDTKYTDIKYSTYKGLYAVFDGETWTYLDSEYLWENNERARYDFATAFSKDGYSVVKKNGTFYAILANGDDYGKSGSDFEEIYDVSGKRIIAKKNGKYGFYNLDFELLSEKHQYDAITVSSCGLVGVKNGDKWGIIEDGGNVVVDFTLEDVAINSLNHVYANNVAMVKKDGKWHLINKKGEDVTENTFFDAKAPESEQYIAVADEEGRWGYIDQKGDLVIDYKYGDAKSFSDGLAAVEYGGSWEYISLRGNVAIDEDMTEAEPFHYGKAIMVRAGQKSVIKLSYYKASAY